MNYGQLLEHLKTAGADQAVHLRAGSLSFLVDLAMADETGVYLVNEPERGGALHAAGLLAALRALETQPEFTAQVFGDSPGGTGEVTGMVEEDGALIFEAPGIVAEQTRWCNDPRISRVRLGGAGRGESTDAALTEQFGPGESMGTGAAGNPAAEVNVEVKPPSPPAAGVLDMIGTGMRLRVPFDHSPATLIDAYGEREPSGPVNDEVVQELLASGHLHKMTKDGVPPVADRKPHDGFRRGWAEIGLDGDAADFYSMVQ